MARRRLDLSTISSRRKLKAGKRYTVKIAVGLALEYRRDEDRQPSWFARRRAPDDPAANAIGYVSRRLGTADDAGEGAPGTLSFTEAWDLAKAEPKPTPTPFDGRAVTVRDAVESYLKWFEKNRRSYDNTRLVLDAHVLATDLADVALADLTVDALRDWLSDLSERPALLRGRRGDPDRRTRATDGDDPEVQRRRRATANRVRTTLFAALNFMVDNWRSEYGPEPVAVWKKVKPFKGTAADTARWLSKDEVARLLRVCSGDFRNLVLGALLTGARRGELAGLRVRDYDSDAETLTIPAAIAKTNRTRVVPLTDEGVQLFESLVAGRPRDARIFTNAGAAWNTHDHHRSMREAYSEAKIEDADFYSLRHTWHAMLKERGVSSYVIAQAAGNSPAMVEQVYGRVRADHVAEQIRANLPTFSKEKPKVAAIQRRRSKATT